MLTGAMFDELAAWLPECGADVLCLQEVTRTPDLDGWTRFSDAERVVKGYLDAGLTGICVTKLDETVQYGGIVHAALPQELPIYYLCDGPRVPEDIQPATIDAVVAALTEGSN